MFLKFAGLKSPRGSGRRLIFAVPNRWILVGAGFSYLFLKTMLFGSLPFGWWFWALLGPPGGTATVPATPPGRAQWDFGRYSWWRRGPRVAPGARGAGRGAPVMFPYLSFSVSSHLRWRRKCRLPRPSPQHISVSQNLCISISLYLHTSAGVVSLGSLPLPRMPDSPHV